MEAKTLNYDLVVTGGGPAGIACAYTAACGGLKTLLVEKNNYLGGQITGALVVPMMKSTSDNINLDFFNALKACARKYGAQVTYQDGNDGWFDPVTLKIVFDEMIKNSGADVLFEADIKGYKVEIKKNPQGTDEKFISMVEFKTGTLSLHIYAKYFVDATGNSNLCEALNCNFIDDNNKTQPNSLRFIIANVNLDEFSKQILTIDPDRDVTTAAKIDGDWHLSTAYTFDTTKAWGLKKIFDAAVADGTLKYTDTAYFQVFTMPNIKNAVAFNCPRLSTSNDSSPFDYSSSLIEGRQTIARLFNFVKKYFSGFENSYIAQIADMTGVRVSKRPKTRYIYKKEDIISGKFFENPVLTADYPIDIHSNLKNSSTLDKVKKYFLPIECLICEDYGNLFVAGRNLGAEFEAQAALRIQKSCISMGEALAKHLLG